MNLFKILERCRENAEKWEAEGAYYGKKFAGIQARQSARDWRTLEKEIGEELDREKNNNQQREAHANK